MAANTLFTLLIKLGFDISELKTGGPAAEKQLASLGAAAANLEKMAAPTTKALENLTAAANAVQGTTGATAAINSMAKAMAAISVATGSPVAMSAFASGARQIAVATNSAPALKAFAAAASEIVTATRNPATLQTFASAASQIVTATNAPSTRSLINFAKAEAQIILEAVASGKIIPLGQAIKAVAADAPTAAAGLNAMASAENEAGAAADTAAQRLANMDKMIKDITESAKRAAPSLAGLGAAGAGVGVPTQRASLDPSDMAATGQAIINMRELAAADQAAAEARDRFAAVTNSAGEASVTFSEQVKFLEGRINELASANVASTGEIESFRHRLQSIAQDAQEGGDAFADYRGHLAGLAKQLGVTTDELADLGRRSSDLERVGEALMHMEQEAKLVPEQLFLVHDAIQALGGPYGDITPEILPAGYAQGILDTLKEITAAEAMTEAQFIRLHQLLMRELPAGMKNVTPEVVPNVFDAYHFAQIDAASEATLRAAAAADQAAAALDALAAAEGSVSQISASVYPAFAAMSAYIDTLVGKSDLATKSLELLRGELAALRVGVGRADIDKLLTMGARVSNLLGPGVTQVGAPQLRGITNYLEALYKVPTAEEMAAKGAADTAAAEAKAAQEAFELAAGARASAAGLGQAAGAANQAGAAANNAAGAFRNLGGAARAASGAGGGVPPPGMGPAAFWAASGNQGNPFGGRGGPPPPPPPAPGGAGAAGGGGGGMGPGGGVAAGFAAVPPAASRAASSVKMFADQVDVAANRASFLNRTLSMAFAFSGGVAVTTAIGFISNALLGFNSRLEQAHIAFTTLLGDSGMADAFIEKMQRFAELTPFDFQGLTEATQRLLAMGFTADQLLPTLRIVGDAVAGLGGSPEKLDRVTVALGQMSTAGRVNAQDMRQLTEAGIPAWAMLAEAIGKTVGETRKMAEAGTINAGTAISAILGGMDTRFRGLMEKQARTAAGAFTTIRDSALAVISGAVGPLYTMISQVMVMMADFFINGGGKMIVPAIQAIGVAIAVFLIPRLLGVVQSAYTASVALGSLTIPLLPMVTALYVLGYAFQENIGGIKDSLGPAIGAVASFARAVAEAALHSGILIPVIEAIALVITTKFVLSLGLSVIGLTASALAATAFGASLGRLAIVLALLAAPITLVIAAITLLILNFEQAAQGVRVLARAFMWGVAAILDGASMLPLVGDAFKGLAAAAHKSADDMTVEMDRVAVEIAEKAAAAAEGTKAPADLFANWPEELKALLASFQTTAAGVDDVTNFIKDATNYNLGGIAAIAGKAGADAMGEMTKGIVQHQTEPLDALIAVHNMLKVQMTQQAEINRLYGELMSADLAAGMASQDPAVKAQAEYTTKLITERLDALTGGAFSAGQNTTLNLANGLGSGKALAALQDALQKTALPVAKALDSLFAGSTLFPGWGNQLSNAMQATIDQIGKVADKVELVNVWNTQYKPAADDASKATEALAKYLRELDETNADTTESTKALTDALRVQAADVSYALNTAFNDIRDRSHSMFGKMHDDAMDWIQDQHDMANAALTDQQKAIQAVVDTFNQQIDAERSLRKETELRAAVANAKTPKDQMAAMQELNDFLQDQQAKVMQEGATKNIAALQAQIDANDKKMAEDKSAETERYNAQVSAFDKEFQALQAFLDRHPEAWSKMNNDILDLLDKYGIDYQSAGTEMGKAFAKGLLDSVTDVAAAAKAVFDTAAAAATTAATTAQPAQPKLPSFEPGHVGEPQGAGVPGGQGSKTATGHTIGGAGSGGRSVGGSWADEGSTGTMVGAGNKTIGNVQAEADFPTSGASGAKVGVGGAAKGAQSKASFTDIARMFLGALGAPTTPGNVYAVARWLAAENSNPTLRNNPWNLHSWGGLPGQIGYDYVNVNDQNVAIFDTIEHGVAANAHNLSHLQKMYPLYGKAIDALKADNPEGFLNMIAQSPWAASGYGLRHKIKGSDGKMHWVDDPNGYNRLMQGYNPPAGYALGAWKLAADQMAMVHAGEMIIPKVAADSLRASLGSDGADVGSTAASRPGFYGEDGGPAGGGTIVLQVDGDVLGRWTDERIYIRRSTTNIED